MFSIRFQAILTLFLPLLLVASEIPKTDSLKSVLESSKGTERFNALIELSKELYKKETDQAKQYLEKAMDMAERTREDPWLAACHYEYGKIYRITGQMDSAVIHFELAYQIQLELENIAKSADILVKIGQIYMKTGSYDLALDHHKKSLELNREIGNRSQESRNLSDIGYVLKVQGHFDQAIKYYQKALTICEDIEDDYNLALNLNRIGSIYRELENYDKALEYYESALSIRAKISDKHGIAGSYNNIGMIYQYTGNFDSAIVYYYKALELNEKSGNERWKSYNLNNIGYSYYNKGNYQESLNYYFKSLEIKEKRKDIKGVIFTLGNISTVYHELGDISLAIEYYERSLELSIEAGLKRQIRQCYYDLAGIHSSAGDYQKAYENMKLYTEINDSINDEDKFKTLTEIQTKYETEKKEKENEILKRDAEIRENLQVLLVVIVTGLLILSVMFFFLFRMKNRSLRKNKLLYEQEKKLKNLELKNNEIEKQRLEELVYAEQKINSLQQEKIQNKNRELSTTTLHILNKNKILSEINNELNRLSSEDKIHTNSVKVISDLIEGNRILDQDWEQFKVHFDEVYEGFFDKLIHNHPNLTQNDLKFCAYLKINLSSKEIARIMNITLNAIKKSRQRLRKKLQLDADEDLLNYLNEV